MIAVLVRFDDFFSLGLGGTLSYEVITDFRRLANTNGKHFNSDAFTSQRILATLGFFVVNLE